MNAHLPLLSKIRVFFDSSARSFRFAAVSVILGAIAPAWTLAQAPQIYYETDFSSPLYSVGNITGQDPLPSGFAWNKTSSGGGIVDIVGAGSGGIPASPVGSDQLLRLIRPTTADAATANQTWLNYTNALRTGMVRFSYTIAMDWGSNFTAAQVVWGGSAMGLNGVATGIHFGSSTGQTNRYLFVRDVNGDYHYLDANPDLEGVSSITRNSFYRFDIVLDIDTEVYTVAVYDASNRKLDSITMTGWYRSGSTQYETMFNRVIVGLPGGGANDTIYIGDMAATIPEAKHFAMASVGLLLLFAVFRRRMGAK